MFCTNCGNKIKSEEEFCTSCGKAVNIIEGDNPNQNNITKDGGGAIKKLIKLCL